jgi:hypothetical protein
VFQFDCGNAPVLGIAVTMGLLAGGCCGSTCGDDGVIALNATNTTTNTTGQDVTSAGIAATFHPDLTFSWKGPMLPNVSAACTSGADALDSDEGVMASMIDLQKDVRSLFEDQQKNCEQEAVLNHTVSCDAHSLLC